MTEVPENEAPEESGLAADALQGEVSEVLILVGSPREKGRSAQFGMALAQNLRAQNLRAALFEVAKHPVAACTGCGVCLQTGDCCIVGDAWGVLSKHMESCATFVVVAPVYFAGPSGWLKAVLDRCQMYWARKYVLHEGVPAQRPAHLVVIGEGGDPFGSEPLETICTSALNCVNLRVDAERITRLIGEDYDLDLAPGLAQIICNDARSVASEDGLA